MSMRHNRGLRNDCRAINAKGVKQMAIDNRRGSMAGGSGYVSRNAHEVGALPMRPTGTPAMEPRLFSRHDK